MKAPFEYVIKRQRRKTIALHVLSDARVELRAPAWVSQKELQAFVTSRAEWVVAKRKERLESLAQKPCFQNGQQHPFLGQLLTLNLQVARRARIEQQGDQLLIELPDVNDQEHVRRLTERWYRRQAQTVFARQLQHGWQQIPWSQLPARTKPVLKIRRMRSRWGSCSSLGIVTLNAALIKMPIQCLDYVVAHELSHLWHLNHSREFYQLLASMMPDWKERERQIEQWSRSRLWLD